MCRKGGGVAVFVVALALALPIDLAAQESAKRPDGSAKTAEAAQPNTEAREASPKVTRPRTPAKILADAEALYEDAMTEPRAETRLSLLRHVLMRTEIAWEDSTEPLERRAIAMRLATWYGQTAALEWPPNEPVWEEDMPPFGEYKLARDKYRRADELFLSAAQLIVKEHGKLNEIRRRPQTADQIEIASSLTEALARSAVARDLYARTFPTQSADWRKAKQNALEAYERNANGFGASKEGAYSSLSAAKIASQLGDSRNVYRLSRAAEKAIGALPDDEQELHLKLTAAEMLLSGSVSIGRKESIESAVKYGEQIIAESAENDQRTDVVVNLQYVHHRLAHAHKRLFDEAQTYSDGRRHLDAAIEHLNNAKKLIPNNRLKALEFVSRKRIDGIIEELKQY